ncbi:MAG: hypothetical protein AB7H86_13385 [Blastocatellales bacterium]
MTYIDELKDAVTRLHGCEAEHLETVPITESFQGQIVWQGEVEVFNLRGHPKASRAYAWSYVTDDKKKHFTAVLDLPPVVSPRSAVRAAIVAEMKGKGK